MGRYSTRTRAETTTESLEADTAPETGPTDDNCIASPLVIQVGR